MLANTQSRHTHLEEDVKFRNEIISLALTFQNKVRDKQNTNGEEILSLARGTSAEEKILQLAKDFRIKKDEGMRKSFPSAEIAAKVAEEI